MTETKAELQVLGKHLSKAQMANLAFRSLSLVSKFILTLYMARFFDLTSLGAYGLIFSSVMCMTGILGQEFGYIVKREVIGIAPVDALHKMRDQVFLHLFNYAVVGLIFLGVCLTGVTEIPSKYFFYVWILTVFEGIGMVFYNNMNSLNQQIMANLTLFVRTGLWIPIVILLGWGDERFRNEDTVVLFWVLGSAFALGLPLWTWRHWGWREALGRPANLSWMKQGIKRCFPLWIGTIGGFITTYVDRYFVSHLLNLEYVGIMTFYYSFISAIVTLMESGVFAFAYPRQIALYKSGDKQAFWTDIRKTALQVTVGGGGICVVMAAVVPVIAYFLGKPEIFHEASVFWMQLIGVFISCLSLCAYYALFAGHHDRPIWIGNVLYLIPVLSFNAVFISLFGFDGIGYSAVLSSLCLLAWRFAFVWRMKREDEEQLCTLTA